MNAMVTLKKNFVTILSGLALALVAGTEAKADQLKVDFSGTVSSFLFYDSPLLKIGDTVSGSVMFDWPIGATPLGTYNSPAGLTTVNQSFGRSGSSTRTAWTFQGSGPSGTFGGLYYTLDGLVVSLDVSIFSPPPLSDVLALPMSDVGIQIRTSQITDNGGIIVTSFSYASLELRSVRLSSGGQVPDLNSTGALVSSVFMLLAAARRFMR
jgi:hypothetical protein